MNIVEYIENNKYNILQKRLAQHIISSVTDIALLNTIFANGIEQTFVDSYKLQFNILLADAEIGELVSVTPTIFQALALAITSYNTCNANADYGHMTDDEIITEMTKKWVKTHCASRIK